MGSEGFTFRHSTVHVITCMSMHTCYCVQCSCDLWSTGYLQHKLSAVKTAATVLKYYIFQKVLVPLMNICIMLLFWIVQIKGKYCTLIHFICLTAIIARQSANRYVALNAGHCDIANLTSDLETSSNTGIYVVSYIRRFVYGLTLVHH